MQLWPANEKAFGGEPRRRVVEVGVGLDDHGRRVPELELDALARRPLGELPADLAGAGERDRAHALVLDEHVADLRTQARRGRSASRAAGRPRPRAPRAGAPRTGVCEAGFSTTAQPAASAGAILWATRLSGKLNGEIAPTTPIGWRSVKASLPVAGLRGVHRHHLAGELAGLDRGHRERRHRARRLDPRRLERLAGLGRDRLRDLLVPAAEVRRRRGRGSRRACGPAAARASPPRRRRSRAAPRRRPPSATRPTSSPE